MKAELTEKQMRQLVERGHNEAEMIAGRPLKAEELVKQLREALRKRVIVRVDVMDPRPRTIFECELCDQVWDFGQPELHAPGCLAAEPEKE